MKWNGKIQVLGVVLCALAGLLRLEAIAAAPAPAQSAATAGGMTKKEIRILCSFFPICQFTRNVTAGRDGVKVEMMLPASLGCPHDYLLTPQDMEKIAQADIFVANGLGLEEFLGAPLRQANPNVTLIDASRGIAGLIRYAGAGEESARRGGNGHEGEAHPDTGINPHLFASPAMAAKMAGNIALELARMDPAGAALYRKNAAAYRAKLERLSEEFKAAVPALRSRKIVTEHGVFDYLARQIGLQVVAVIEEVPGQEPSAAQMLELVKTIKASGAAAVFTEPQYPAAVGQAIARELGLPVAVLDPVATGPDHAPLDFYEQAMRNNLKTLKRTLLEK